MERAERGILMLKLRKPAMVMIIWILFLQCPPNPFNLDFTGHRGLSPHSRPYSGTSRAVRNAENQASGQGLTFLNRPGYRIGFHGDTGFGIIIDFW
jgi:hypothetical protein